MNRAAKPPRPTRRARLRPSLDHLEGRLLMANAGGVDPTFGGGSGYVVGSINPATGSLFAIPNPLKTVVEADGSLVVAFPEGVAGATTFGVSHILANGTIDAAFGVGGRADVTLPGMAIVGGGPTTLLVQADRKIVVVGVVAPSPQQSFFSETVVARFNADGSVDSTFGTNGVATVSIPFMGAPSSNLPYAALQIDGKIVLAGTVDPSPIAAVRLTSTGAIDTTYGTNGVAVPSGSTLNESADGLVITSGGQAEILATTITTVSGQQILGPSLFRLNADGSQDTSLSSIGLIHSGLASPDANGLIVVPSGLILVLGKTTGGIPALASLNADGTPLGSFPLFDSSTELTGFAVDPHGRVLLSGVFPGSPDFSSSSSSLEVFRLAGNLQPDPSFGQAGYSSVPIPASLGGSHAFSSLNVAIDPSSGDVILAGANSFEAGLGFQFAPTDYAVARLASDTINIPSKTVAGDYTGDGKADPAVYLPSQGAFAIGDSSGKTTGRIVPFGTAGAGQTIPVQGDFYGTGQDDIAAYLVGSGTFAIQDPTGLTSGKFVPFGTPGAGQSIPAPGDYYGNGQSDIAVYLAASGAFAIQDPTGQTAGRTIPFGKPGLGQSIPVPGDYDGSGRTELAVYVPSQGAFYYRSAKPFSGDVAIPFGPSGLGASLPMPGDYDGSGQTEVAVYIPSQGAVYYRPAKGGPDVKITIGTPGTGKTLPAPGDYTGSGHAEVGVYLTDTGTLTYQPAGGGQDVSIQFGSAGAGQAIPVTSTVLVPFPGPQGGGNQFGGSFEVPGGPDALEGSSFLLSSKKAKPGARPAS